MNQSQFTLTPIAECSVMLHFTGDMSATQVAQLSEQIQHHFPSSITNVTPAYQQILIDYLPFRIAEDQLLLQIQQLLTSASLQTQLNAQASTVTLPVYYGLETAIDLERYLQHNIDLTRLVGLHTEPTYDIEAIGFAPGFAFMNGVNPAIQLPRLSSPRTHIAAGSVAIADDKTAVYPTSSPGGWNIIGRCPVTLFNPDSQSVLPYRVGDKIKFESISRDEFIALGGVL